MYSQFRVQNFRGFKDLELKDLARVNLIAGKNNVGKTSLLEAIYISNNPYNAELPVKVNSFRGMRMLRINAANLLDTSLDSLFYGFDASLEILLESKDAYGDYKYIIRIPSDDRIKASSLRVNENGIFDFSGSSNEILPTQPLEIEDIEGRIERAYISFQNEKMIFKNPNYPIKHPSFFFSATWREAAPIIAERYSNIVTIGHEANLIETLRAVEPKIQSLRLLYQNGEPYIAAETGDRKPVPLIFMGDGIVRLLNLATAIGNAENGVVLIDEIENGLHYSIQADVWKAIAKAAELFNVQIFATTHSLEMIQSAQTAFQDLGEDAFRYYRLDREENGDIQAVKYSPKTMSAAINMNYEVRG
jgi:AAA15 family ATPase/GTPase